MECNRDEAEKCIDIAYKYLLAGNEQIARKMCHKAERLYPSIRIKELRRAIDYHEQVKHVERVKRCKNLYEILDVSTTSTNQEIRKAFKKLALVLHPDKNHAPGAHEAFVKAQNAMNILTDPEKRTTYDFSRQPTGYHQDNVNAEQQWAGSEHATQWNGPLSFNGYGYGYYYPCPHQMYHPQDYSVPSYWYCHQNYYSYFNSSHGLYNNWYC
ncbi:dnaJ homolog subfamily B member 14-like [Phlebotomus papatasi]|uniref:dnaJ homolog subfamily B member 14-like n=1 Tax=Phlebotomus papatasi TaxID=29031 RepID=UPI002483F873|nr:dnaJ homolog subfamily B member 14-like [Phlebotomus papatasi]